MDVTDYTFQVVLPDVSVVGAANSGEMNEFVGVLGSVFDMVNSISWLGVPLFVWLCGIVVFGLVVSFFVGGKK